MTRSITQTLSKSTFQRYLAATAAMMLVTSMSASAALNAAQKEIQAYLPTGVSLEGPLFPTPAQYAGAANAAIKNPTVKPKTAPSAIVAQAAKEHPEFSPSFTQTALTAVYSPTPPPALAGAAPAKIETEAANIIKNAFKNALATTTAGIVAQPYEKRASYAAAITAVAVNATKNIALPAGRKLTPLQVVIKTAITAVKTPKVGGNFGVSGVVTGTISQVAGVGNAALDVNATTGDDALVKAVLLTAVQTVGTGKLAAVQQIAEAAGYAFAATYRKTVVGPESTLTAFLSANQNAIAAAIALAYKKAPDALTLASIAASAGNGIKLAYSGGDDTLGSKGTGEFAYNNGTGTPVTDFTGL